MRMDKTKLQADPHPRLELCPPPYQTPLQVAMVPHWQILDPALGMRAL